jgi:hypothetical protein
MFYLAHAPSWLFIMGIQSLHLLSKVHNLTVSLETNTKFWIKIFYDRRGIYLKHGSVIEMHDKLIETSNIHPSPDRVCLLGILRNPQHRIKYLDHDTNGNIPNTSVTAWAQLFNDILNKSGSKHLGSIPDTVKTFFFCLFKMLKPALGPTQLPIRWLPKLLPLKWTAGVWTWPLTPIWPRLRISRITLLLR